jgi:hypothetical protein
MVKATRVRPGVEETSLPSQKKDQAKAGKIESRVFIQSRPVKRGKKLRPTHPAQIKEKDLEKY